MFMYSYNIFINRDSPYKYHILYVYIFLFDLSLFLLGKQHSGADTYGMHVRSGIL